MSGDVDRPVTRGPGTSRLRARSRHQGLVQVLPMGGVAASPVAVNPNVVEAFEPTVPLYGAFLTTTWPVVPVLVPFQRLLIA